MNYVNIRNSYSEMASLEKLGIWNISREEICLNISSWFSAVILTMFQIKVSLCSHHKDN
jgi:hypothetical protein